MANRLLTPPTVDPLHIDAIRLHLREDLTENDALISIYLSRALEEAMAETGRQLVVARYQKVFDGFSPDMLLDIAPLVQIVAIHYMDATGAWVLVPPVNYRAESSFNPNVVVMVGVDWPVAQAQVGAVRITYDAGYVACMVADALADTVTLQGWRPLVVSDVVRLSNSGGALPMPLRPQTDYHIVGVVAPGTYRLSAAAGGLPVDILDGGTGTHYAGQIGEDGTGGEMPGGILSWLLMEVESQYSFRGNLINSPSSSVQKHPFRNYMLDPYRLSYM